MALKLRIWKDLTSFRSLRPFLLGSAVPLQLDDSIVLCISVHWEPSPLQFPLKVIKLNKQNAAEQNTAHKRTDREWELERETQSPYVWVHSMSITTFKTIFIHGAHWNPLKSRSHHTMIDGKDIKLDLKSIRQLSSHLMSLSSRVIWQPHESREVFTLQHISNSRDGEEEKQKKNHIFRAVI